MNYLHDRIRSTSWVLLAISSSLFLHGCNKLQPESAATRDETSGKAANGNGLAVIEFEPLPAKVALKEASILQPADTAITTRYTAFINATPRTAPISPELQGVNDVVDELLDLEEESEAIVRLQILFGAAESRPETFGAIAIHAARRVVDSAPGSELAQLAQAFSLKLSLQIDGPTLLLFDTAAEFARNIPKASCRSNVS